MQVITKVCMKSLGTNSDGYKLRNLSMEDKNEKCND